MLIMLLAMSTSLMAVDYYVDPLGTDDVSHGEGTGTDAWKTIEWAVNNVSDPTTATIIIHVSGDTYTLNSNDIDIDRGFGSTSGGLTIRGAGSTIVQAAASSGTANDRVFYINGSDETVALEDMTILYGKTTSYGGGLYNMAGTLTMINCTVSGNTSGYSGGGLESYAGTLTMTNCTVSGNTAEDYGGGLTNNYGTLTMTNCTVSGNTVNPGSLGGGGLFTYEGPATITNCTFANNSVPNGDGGGIYLYSNSLYIKNTIIANNSAQDYPNYYYVAGTLTDNGYNIVETTNVGAGSNGFTNGTNNDIVGAGTYNLSTTLEDNNTLNGTQTLKTTDGSAAINAGSNSGANNGVNPPAQDQRGAERNGATDIGAYEWWDDDGSLPVTLSSFTAQYIESIPVLCWTTQSETSNAGWNIYRSQTDILEEAMQINTELIPGVGTTSEPTDYIYEDESELMENTEYWYWLESIDYSGLTGSYGPISLIIPEEGEEPGSPEIPGVYGLHQNYPNPFNPSTEISFMMKESCVGELSIYNIKGQKIRILFTDKSILKDELLICIWNGKDESGKEVSTGVYYYKLRTTKGNYVRKMILMK